MMRLFVPICLLALLSSAVFGQSAGLQSAEAAPKFDAADIHSSPHMATALLGGALRPGGRYEVTVATMVDLIRIAYGVEADKVVGGPSWLEYDRFDIFAKAPPTTSPANVKLMLQALLADRFKLVVHKDSHPQPAFGLTVGKGGAKLKEASGSGETGCTLAPPAAQAAVANPGGGVTINLPAYSYTCRNMTMAAFVEGMRGMSAGQAYLGATPVVDQTGLKGAWDFSLKYTSKPPAALGAAGITLAGDPITLFEAIDKQLGLKLDSITAPAPVIVVDSVNRRPTDNLPGVESLLPPQAKFEVADLRLSAPGAALGGSGLQPGGRYEVRGMPLKSLIVQAWNLRGQDELVGAPKWLDTAKIDLIAKFPSGGGGPSQYMLDNNMTALAATLGTQAIDQGVLYAAIKALFIERFKISIHTEMRPGNGYVLTAVKPKLKAADPQSRTLCKDGPGPDGKDPRPANPINSRLITCQNVTMAQLAEQILTRVAAYFPQREILDATGLDGTYDLTLNFAPPAAFNGRGGGAAPDGAGGTPTASDPNGAISLFDALQKQLGLKLELQKRPVPMVILDHIEEKPADN
jgi:uncharacterized protein (TIGR03435 family)